MLADMPKASDKSLLPGYVSVPTAPIINFDVVPASGYLAGMIQIELAGRILLPLTEGRLDAHLIEVGRLRCSPHAATLLKEALETVLSKIDRPQSPPMAAAAKANGDQPLAHGQLNRREGQKNGRP
jgi:hypothetical protein